MVLSLGNLMRNGFVFKFKGENDSVMCYQSDPRTTVSFLVVAHEQLANSCEPSGPSCESCRGRRHAIATVFPISVEIAGSVSILSFNGWQNVHYIDTDL